MFWVFVDATEKKFPKFVGKFLVFGVGGKTGGGFVQHRLRTMQQRDREKQGQHVKMCGNTQATRVGGINNGNIPAPFQCRFRFLGKGRCPLHIPTK